MAAVGTVGVSGHASTVCGTLAAAGCATRLDRRPKSAVSTLSLIAAICCAARLPDAVRASPVAVTMATAAMPQLIR
jgi:hypothetical protein